METVITLVPAEVFHKCGGQRRKNMPGGFQIVSLPSV